MTTRNGRRRWLFPLVLTARGYNKLEMRFAKMGNFDLEVLAPRVDFLDIGDERMAQSSKQDRWAA